MIDELSKVFGILQKNNARSAAERIGRIYNPMAAEGFGCTLA